MNHYCNTKDRPSDTPILTLNNFKVIGEYYGGSKNQIIKLNFGTFIKYAINEFNSKYKNDKVMTTTNKILIKYKIGKENKVRIFGDDFVKNNKIIFQMIINDKNYELNSFYKIRNEKENEILKIKLKQINNVTNLCSMFEE